jgi:hypothetical protein
VNEKRVIVCRSVSDGVTQGAALGYECSICGEALQLTFGGQTALKSYPDSDLLCNACGLVYSEIADSVGALERIELSPEAKDQLERQNASPLAKFVRKRA